MRQHHERIASHDCLVCIAEPRQVIFRKTQSVLSQGQNKLGRADASMYYTMQNEDFVQNATPREA